MGSNPTLSATQSTCQVTILEPVPYRRKSPENIRLKMRRLRVSSPDTRLRLGQGAHSGRTFSVAQVRGSLHREQTHDAVQIDCMGVEMPRLNPNASACSTDQYLIYLRADADSSSAIAALTLDSETAAGTK